MDVKQLHLKVVFPIAPRKPQSSSLALYNRGRNIRVYPIDTPRERHVQQRKA
jgi:hypothetical protein